jgi:hypothetical protein
MARVKNTVKIVNKHVSASLMKKTKKAMKAAKLLVRDSKGLLHTGKLKIPFKAASSKAMLSKNDLVKRLKRRWVCLGFLMLFAYIVFSFENIHISAKKHWEQPGCFFYVVCIHCI